MRVSEVRIEEEVRWGRLRWAAGLALCSVALRLLLFDYATFFGLAYISNHDMHQGASLFASSMHSMRLSGDIAWWNPAYGSGYAQYYQALLSPLAPTIGHVVFIVWAELVFVLSRLGVVVPEYFQYLTVTFIVLPFLATLAFALLCGLLFRSRSAVTLAAIVFTFSSIGLWHSAWFYFQEPATMLFLLAAVIAFFQKPRPRTVLLVLAAALVQLASFNYWTLFNAWFVVIFLGCYLVVHPLQVRRAGRRLGAMAKRWPLRATAVAVGTCVVGTLWIVIIAGALLEQSSFYERVSPVTLAQALGSVRPAFYLGRMFHPEIEAVMLPQRPGTHWTMHHAVYLGAFLVPLLVALPFYRTRRLERWLLISGATLLPICFAVAPVLWAWEHVPWMNKLRHLFMFYPAFVRLVVVLLCCASLDRIVTGARVRAVRAALGSVALASALALYLLGWTGGGLPRLGEAPEALLVLVPAALLGLAWIRPSPRHRALLGAVILIVALVDLGTYFQHVSRLDGDFTAQRNWITRPLTTPVVEALRRPWAPFDPERADGLFGNMPVRTEFWPDNIYMPHLYVTDLGRSRESHWDEWSEFLGFHPNGNPTWVARRARGVLVPVPHEWRYRDYNGWRMVVDVPEAGWLSVAQLHDPAWRASVDGRPVGTQRANFVNSAIRVDGGHHEVQMEYRPLSRRLYWPASAALELALLVLGVAAWKVGPGRVTARPGR